MPESGLATVVPAQVSFLAIYNPLLGPTDESIHQQVVYYTRTPDHLRKSDIPSSDTDVKERRDEANEKLRQIGLAQGMVSFARNFSKGQPVEYVETEKSRIVLHELERNWWILASIDLTRLPSEATGGSVSATLATPSYQYSSRELCPPQLLIQHLRRANSLFLLHHDFTLEGLYHRVGRREFCRLLEGFWDKFVHNWEVLLSGNPTVDIFNGVKLSAGGELGVGVGEEQWGSGEREVFEDFVSRTEGLVDLVVSRFGDAMTVTEPAKDVGRTGGPSAGEENWLGCDAFPRPSDGMIFSGVGAIARTSLVPISHWVEMMYRHGDDAYGVGVDPKAARRRKHRRRRGREAARVPGPDSATPTAEVRPQVTSPERALSPGIPPPLITGTRAPPPRPVAVDRSRSRISSQSTPTESERGSDWSTFGTDTFLKYLTLGYGSSWSFHSQSPSTHLSATSLNAGEGAQGPSEAQKGVAPATDSKERGVITIERSGPLNDSQGRFLLGLRDDIEAADDRLSDGDESSAQHSATRSQKIVLRTLQVEVNSDEGEERKQLQVVVYVRQPFVFMFLFEMDTPSLNTAALYHSIHHQLGPLQKPLLTSTAQSTAFARISMAEHASDSTRRVSARTQSKPVYDLVYDPTNLTIRSSIPNIPDLHSPHLTHPLPSSRDAPASMPWSRVESLGVHHRLLSTYIETRSRPHELERTCKTSRGWWVVWIRMTEEPATTQNIRPDTVQTREETGMTINTKQAQEAFLVRRASDNPSAATSRGGAHGHGRSSSSGARFFRDLGGANSSSSTGSPLSRAEMSPAKLVEGLGLDARRYIEGLLSLNR